MRRFCYMIMLLAILDFGSVPLHAQDGILNETETASTVPPDVVVEFHDLEIVEKEIAKVAALPGGQALNESIDEEVQVWIPQIFMGLDNAYSDNQMRYLSARVTVLNRGNEPLSIQSGKMTLTAWGDSYQLNSSSEKNNLMPIRIGFDSYSLRELQTPEELTIPVGKAVSFWAVYTDLEKSSVVGDLQLELPLVDREAIQHDLRKEQEAHLGLDLRRIGPADALGLLSIHGSLNAINAQDVADQLQRLKDQKVERAVISWDEGAPKTIDDLVDWLLHRAAQELNNELYVQFPAFETFKFLALASLPEENAEAGYEDQFEELIFKSTEQAAIAGLTDLFTRIDPKYLTSEIRSGHLYSQRAALKALAVRQDHSLSENLFPLLSSLYDTSDEETRPFVLLAIGQQNHPQAIPMLTKITRMEHKKEAAAAFTALVKSNQQSAIQTVRKLLTEGELNVPRSRQVRILSENFRREWTEYLVEALDAKSPKVRSAAMEGFVKVGHPNLNRILQRGLSDSSEDVRETAFAALVEKEDQQSESMAVDYALKLLAEGNLNENVLLIITRTRDQRAAPLVLKLIDEKPQLRSGLLTLLKEIGDQKSVRKLIDNLEDFQPDEQVLIFELAISLDLPEQFELAQQAVQSEASEVREMGLQMLTQQASDQAAEEIAKLLDTENQEQMTQACYSLGRVGTKRAEQLLKEFRRKAYEAGNENELKSASVALRLWMSHSPGWNAIDSAYYHSNVDNYENALVYFELAAEIDPDLGVAYSGMGNSFHKLNRFEEALTAFQKAYELDEFDGQAITGIGIVKAIQGETEEAVQFTLKSADKFPKDNIFSYNTACVYGRAIEHLKKESPQESAEEIRQYQAAALERLKDSIEYGFDEFSLMRTDPDLDSLRDLPEFAELLKN